MLQLAIHTVNVLKKTAWIADSWGPCGTLQMVYSVHLADQGLSEALGPEEPISNSGVPGCRVAIPIQFI